MEKFNILIVHNYYKTMGGEGIIVDNEKKMLEENGHHVFLYTRDNKEIDSYSFLEKLSLPFNYLFNIKTFNDVRNIIKKEHIDIVHVHNTVNIISDSVYYAAFSLNIPVVKTIHNYRLLCPNALFYRDGHICEDCLTKGIGCAIKNKCYRNSYLQTLLTIINMKIQRSKKLYSKLNYICLTEFAKDKLQLLSQINDKRIYIKPNFVESNISFIDASDRENKIVFAGRLDEYKGIKFIFEVWKQYINNPYQLIVFGDGELFDWCTKFISDNNISNITVMGNKSHNEVLTTMSESKAVILSSKLYEGLPTTVLDSFSVGTPVITADFGNAGDLIDNGINGYKYIPNSINSCINSINNISNSAFIYQSTFKLYKSYYTKEINYKKLIDIYHSIIEEAK